MLSFRNNQWTQTVVAMSLLMLSLSAEASRENKEQASDQQTTFVSNERSAADTPENGNTTLTAKAAAPKPAKVSRQNSYSYRYKTISGGVVSNWSSWIYANGENCMENILTEERLKNGEIYAVGINNRFGDDYHYFISTVQYYIKEYDLSVWEADEVGENGYYQAWSNIKPSENKLPSIETLILPDKEFKIGGTEQSGAFQFWIALRNVQFGPNSRITKLSPSAFQECHNLTLESCQAILDHLADGTDIGARAFDRCDEGLTGSAGLTIPATVRRIGNYAFSECKLLEKVTINEGATAIGNHAFNMCMGMKSVTIPSTVGSI